MKLPLLKVANLIKNNILAVIITLACTVTVSTLAARNDSHPYPVMTHGTKKVQKVNTSTTDINPEASNANQSESTVGSSTSPTPSTKTPTKSSNFDYNSALNPPAATVTPTCYQPIATAAANQRQTSIDAENHRHDQYVPSAPPDSSYWEDAMAQEDANHQAKLAQIEVTYQQNMASSHC